MKTSRIDTPVLQVLSACRIEGTRLFLPPEKLDRDLYLAVNKILENLGGKWNRSAQAHIFAEDPTEGLDQCIRTGEVTLLKKNGFFPTPAVLADRMCDLAGLTQGQWIFEPSCGDGAILDAITRRFPNYRPTGSWDMLINGFELNPDLAQKCAAKGHEVSNSDFMLWNGGGYNRCVMNPPFERLQDCIHTVRAFDRMARGGRLVGILSSGVTFRRERQAQECRELIDRFGTLEALPEKTFHESGTDVNTVLVVLNKPTN